MNIILPVLLIWHLKIKEFILLGGLLALIFARGLPCVCKAPVHTVMV